MQVSAIGVTPFDARATAMREGVEKDQFLAKAVNMWLSSQGALLVDCDTAQYVDWPLLKRSQSIETWCRLVICSASDIA